MLIKSKAMIRSPTLTIISATEHAQSILNGKMSCKEDQDQDQDTQFEQCTFAK
jgi:hypothetical protein